MIKYDFTGRLAMVTGAGSGMGKAAAVALADAGCTVVVADINLEAVKQTLGTLKNSPHHLPHQVDVSNEESVTKLHQAIKDKYARSPSIIIHAAGIVTNALRKSVFDTTVDEWTRVNDVNAKGTFLVNKVFGRAMMDEKITNGSIVNFSSLASRNGAPKLVDYCASKAAVNSITEAFGAELAASGIRVNAVAPTYIDTPFLGNFAPDSIKQVAARTPLGRIGNTDDVINVCMFLASEQSSFITREIISVTGGFKA